MSEDSMAGTAQPRPDWNDTRADYPRDSCIHELFEAQAKRDPDATAVVFEDQRLSFGALNARANELAHHLRGRGVRPEVMVGICMERSIEMVVGLLAILKAGGAYVPLTNARGPPENVQCEEAPGSRDHSGFQPQLYVVGQAGRAHVVPRELGPRFGSRRIRRRTTIDA
jgi:hypothetical protein